MIGFIFTFSLIAALFCAVILLVISTIFGYPSRTFIRFYLVALASILCGFALFIFSMFSLPSSSLGGNAPFYWGLLFAWCVPNSILNKLFLKFEGQSISWPAAIGFSLASAPTFLFLGYFLVSNL